MVSDKKIPGPQTLSLITSRVVFKNNSGIPTNIYSRISEFLARRHSSIGDKNQKQKRWKNKDKKGFFEPKSKVDSDLIETIQSKMDRHIDSEKNKTKEKSGKIISKRLCTKLESPFPFHKNIPEIKEIMDENIINIAREYYGGAHVLPFEVNLYRNFHIPPEDLTDGLLSNHWHQDGDYTDILKLFVNISNVTKKDGPLHFVSRQQSADLMPEYKHPDGIPDELVKENSNVIRATGSPGTAVFVNTNKCLHRAGVPEKNHSRDILQIKLLPSTEPMPENWLENASEFELTDANRPPKTIFS